MGRRQPHLISTAFGGRFSPEPDRSRIAHAYRITPAPKPTKLGALRCILTSVRCARHRRTKPAGDGRWEPRRFWPRRTDNYGAREARRDRMDSVTPSGDATSGIRRIGGDRRGPRVSRMCCGFSFAAAGETRRGRLHGPRVRWRGRSRTRPGCRARLMRPKTCCAGNRPESGSAGSGIPATRPRGSSRARSSGGAGARARPRPIMSRRIRG